MSIFNSDSVDQNSDSVGSYSLIHDQKPCKGNSSSPDLGPDAKLWLNHDGLEEDYSLGQLNVLEADVKIFAAAYVDGNAKAPAENKLIEDYCNIDPKNASAFCSDIPLEHFCSHRKTDIDSWLLEFESTICDDFLSTAHWMGMDSCNCPFSERPEKLCSDLDSHWIGVKMIEPWWHAVDKQDIASLVSHTSSHHISNCDQSGIKSMHGEKVPRNCVLWFDQFEEKMIDKETKVLHVGKDKSQSKQGLMESILQESGLTFSSGDSLNIRQVDSADTEEPRGDLSRAQLLEALCHSQTRAREAEKLAQIACDEKDHMINLFFQQASCLSAYRQWLCLLEMETSHLQLSSKDQVASFPTPSPLRRVQKKGMTLKKNGCGDGRKKVCRKRCNVRKRAIAFAIGLSLAGAGLLVGWTVGWLFPAF